MIISTKYIASMLLIFISIAITAEGTPDDLNLNTARLNLARSTEHYPVTPGDIYHLTYQSGLSPFELYLHVDNSGSLNASLFGSFDIVGKTFSQLKHEMEKHIESIYPDSFPVLSIFSVGTFQFKIRGEVQTSGIRKGWGLTRLSEIFDEVKTAYTSVRNISIINNHQQWTYDLFAALQLGDFSQNPLIKPGDIIEFPLYEKQVTLNGEIRRPGTYEVFPGETLSDIIEIYGNGFSELADQTRIEISRWDSDSNTDASLKKSLYITMEAGKTPLANQDAITVHSIENRLPPVYIQGAFENGTPIDKTAELKPICRIKHSLSANERISTVFSNLDIHFSDEADFQNAFIQRGSEIIPVDLRNILFHYNIDADLFMEPNDVINIPFLQNFIHVNGAVNNPGRYPFQPGRDTAYYINLAGGRDHTKNNGTGEILYDSMMNTKSSLDTVFPEDTIFLPENGFNYSLGEIAPIIGLITSAVGLAATITTIILNVEEIRN